MVSLVIVAVAVVASFFMAWALGASSNSPPFAPAVGAGALPTMRAAFFIGVFAGLGAILQGGSISKTVGRGLIDGVSLTPLAAIAGLLTAAAYIAAGTWTGYPIPAAFATSSAIVGAGLALGGEPAFGTYRRIATFWVLVPIMSGGIAYPTARLLRRDDVPETVSVPVLGGLVGYIVANVSFSFLPARGDEPATVVRSVANALGADAPTIVGSYDVVMVAVSLVVGVTVFAGLRRLLRQSVDAGIRNFLIGLGALVAFSSGGSQVGLATGPLEALFTQLAVPGIFLLALGGFGILAGAWMGSPRLLQAVAREYSQLGVRRSIAALVPGFVIAQLAIALGIPISFNNIMIASVICSGLAAGTGGVSPRKIGFTIAIWLATLGSAAVVGYGLYTLLSLVPGV